MDFSENKYDSNSNTTIILWTNDVPLVEDIKTGIPLLDISQKVNENVYKAPQELGEKYLYLIMKTANDLVNSTIEETKWIIQNCFKTRRSNSEYIQTVIQKCKNRLRTYNIDSLSLMTESEWLNENGVMDDYTAITKISNYINQNWNLDAKYLFTVKKTNTSVHTCSTCHNFKVEFSVSTKEYPIPDITVSALFTIEITSLLSIPVYVKYQLEMDRRVYVVGKHSFNKNRFEHLFKIKRDTYMDINKYPGWSFEPSYSRL